MASEDKAKFTAESGLGFMRFFQFWCVLYLLIFLLLMVFITGYTITFSPVFATLLYSFLFRAVSIWLVGRRLAVARKAVIIMLIIESVMDIAFYGYMGYGPSEYFAAMIPNILWIIYFATSRRAKAVLVRSFNSESLGEIQRARSREMFDFRSKDFWLRMLVYFFMFCVIGHWMEATFCMLVNMGIMPGNITPSDSIQFRDQLNPFPIYGIGFVACVLLLHPLKTFCLEKFKKLKGSVVLSILAVYVGALVIVAAAELILGFTCNQEYTVWDYRNQPFNFEGQICLSYTCMFAFAASMVVWVFFPLLEFMFEHVSRDAFRVIFVVSLVMFLLLFVAYSLDANEIFDMPGLSLDMQEVEKMGGATASA